MRDGNDEICNRRKAKIGWATQTKAPKQPKNSAVSK